MNCSSLSNEIKTFLTDDTNSLPPEELGEAGNKRRRLDNDVPRDLILFALKKGDLITFDPIGVNTFDVYQKADESKPPFMRKFTPQFTGNPRFRAIFVQTQTSSLDEITDEVKEIYRLMVEGGEYTPGPFGDQIRLLQLGNESSQYVITQIAQNAFPKPGLAADIIPVFKCKNEMGGDLFFVLTGTRKFDPGMGMNATLGGFTGIERRDPNLAVSADNPCVLDSEIYTALKEGKEEGNLRIEVPGIERYREDYEASIIEGVIRCGAKEREIRSAYKAVIHKLGTIKTSDALMQDGGECLPNGEKRVYATTGFACFVDLGGLVVKIAERTNDEFLSHFKFSAADDIAGLQVHDITRAVMEGSKDAMDQLKSRLQFGIQHHNDLIDLLIPKIQAICLS